MRMSLLRATDGPELDPHVLGVVTANHVEGIEMAAFTAKKADDGAIAELAAQIARDRRVDQRFGDLIQRLDIVTVGGSY